MFPQAKIRQEADVDEGGGVMELCGTKEKDVGFFERDGREGVEGRGVEEAHVVRRSTGNRQCYGIFVQVRTFNKIF